VLTSASHAHWRRAQRLHRSYTGNPKKARTDEAIHKVVQVMTLRNSRTTHETSPGSKADTPAAAAGQSIITRVGDYRIHTMQYGKGDRVLLLIHGLSGSSRWWSRNVGELCRDRRVLVPDLIGFGRSRTVGRLPRIADIADLLLHWIVAMDLDRLAIVGHSMGGQISIHLVTAAPERVERLALVDSSGIPRTMSPRALIRFATEAGPLWRWGDPTFLPVIAGDAFTAGPRVLLRAIQNLLLDDVRPLLPQIDVSTLILWGERDGLVPLADAFEFRRLIPDSRLAVLRGAAHNPMVDRPTDFNRILLRFLNDEAVGR
jgi:pimeloyl-ACP methyl ester carboxylesterase